MNTTNKRRAGVSTLQWALIGVVAVLVIAAAYLYSRLAFAPTRAYGMAFYPYFPLGFEFLGGFFILFIFAMLLALLWTGRRSSRQGAYQQDEAVRILRERYAKGEITKEQFDQMERDLIHS